jgi:hypothetical protein
MTMQTRTDRDRRASSTFWRVVHKGDIRPAIPDQEVRYRLLQRRFDADLKLRVALSERQRRCLVIDQRDVEGVRQGLVHVVSGVVGRGSDNDQGGHFRVVFGGILDDSTQQVAYCIEAGVERGVGEGE